ncbi:MAG: proline racemase family protein, partial [Acidobacteriota bacterium]
PCGTGTSAKMAVLHTRGELAIGQRWRQESITGGRFVGWLTECDEILIPHIQGRAWITGHTELFFPEDDPLRDGFSGAIG